MRRINKSLIINIAISIASLVIFFGLCEIYARYRYYGGFLTEHGFQSRNGKYATKKVTPIRMICVGGSTTHGGGDVESNETYPFYLEQILNNKFHQRMVEVINSGLPATPTEYHRDFIRDRIDDQELDTLIVHSIYNHFSSFYPAHYDPKIDKILIERSSKVKTMYRWDKMNLAEMANIFLMEHSFFYTRLREKILKMRGEDYRKYYEKKQKFVYGQSMDKEYDASSDEDKKNILASFVARYEKAIDDIILTAKERNVDVILIIPPYPFFPEEKKSDLADSRPGQYYNEVFEKARQVTLAMGKKYDLLVVDADEGFLRHGRNQGLFIDAVHLTPKGNYLLADIAAAKMARSRLLAR